ncbi:MAG: UDP-N-acetylmuramoyl-L-alanine--D-glutamate ligase [Candidatus Binatus sp.]|uniref:UDP-N-acetylmuramoyl-L-alanine--D-glutamate ligase n=1 Tax=Candidatus Binatus sp. TaxID=2811406 RepID=UPI00272491CE|nr:UDP-N-acetylmuramoyl-L-alanine--D-glutamate ligase [Candidatus Binatus sp.]MDO8432427.1 UDP-N-acetylmuramoyl-L-alanine--D-glutamate ligase [Candidatus Binatus sp.]
MELRGKRVMVVGLGVSGLAAARFLASRGAHLTMTDRRVDLDRSKLPAGDVKLGAEDAAWMKNTELVVTSPGVPRDSKLLRAAVEQGIPVIGELELASRYVEAPIAAVTGTNGKSTVVVLLGEIFKAAGLSTFVGGNLGTPLIDAVGARYDVVVAEVSSFQLEWIEQFSPKIAVHLNLTDDHFDRYRDLDDYGAAKARIFENQNADAWAILNRDDPNVWKLASKIRSRVIGFGYAPQNTAPSLWIEGDEICFDLGDRRGRISVEKFHLRGRHNLSNAMAASAAALAMGIDASTIERALEEFAGLPHRIEFVRETGGVKYIDDSKGTNVGAAVEAIDAIPAPIILIAGGLDKGGDYAPLRKPLKEKVRLAILNGAARDTMRDALDGATTIAVVATLRDAVEHAAREAKPGDTVLMSPACSSFDQFKDYAERGNIFKELVRAL